MTSRERLLITLRGGIADRVPVAPFVQEEYLSFYYPEKTKLDRVIDAVELANELDFDLMAKHRAIETPHFLRHSYPDWELRRSEIREADMIRKRLEIVMPSRTLVQEEVRPDAGAATSGVSFMVTRHMLQDSDDATAFLEHLPPLNDTDRREMHDIAATWSGIIGERGVLAPWGFAGVFNFCCDLCGMENVYTMPYEDEPRYRALMEGISAAQAAAASALADTAVDCIGMQGHMAGGATTGPDFFHEFVMPYERHVVEAIRDAGKFSVYHNCGFARNLYGNYRDIGMTVWETVSEMPRGDNKLAEAKSVLGDKICLLGNLDQVDFLKRATPQEVVARTRDIVALGKPGGRFIFSTSDFLEKNTPRENVDAMIEAAKEAGKY
ncbi:MAG: hypothetical protein A2283_11090 [Lentisphaerae bacterium RIFOXYA12_FULL_48_11]|nr:MAG: hypothetical protein A2283_11090 [Lentisphaerae bacterium RIFOXYA12_FULL_48_11]